MSEQLYVKRGGKYVPVDAIVRHGNGGRGRVCGDCGKKGEKTGDNSVPSGARFCGSITWYECSCGNSWSDYESAS